MGARPGNVNRTELGAAARGTAGARREAVGSGSGGSLKFGASHSRVQIRLSKQMSKGEVMEKVFGIVGTPFIRLFESTRGFTALLNDEDSQRLTGEKSVRDLKAEGIEVVPPPDFKTRRSIFVRGLDPIAGGHSPAETRDELVRSNDWMEVDEIIKIKNYTHVMKIVFKDICSTERALRDGFLLFCMRVSPDQIKQETFTPLMTCFTCFKYERHSTYQCPDRGMVTLCSECSESGHTWRECKSTTKKCVNCGGPHRTLAMACPIKKKAIEEKRRSLDAEKARPGVGGQTYAGVVAPAGSASLVTREDQLKIVTIVECARTHEKMHPGEYGRELNSLLKANGFPTIVFPQGSRMTLAEAGRADSQLSAQSERSGEGYISDGLFDQPNITITHSGGKSGDRRSSFDSVSSVQYKPVERRPSDSGSGSGARVQEMNRVFSVKNLVPEPDEKGNVYNAAKSSLTLFMSRRDFVAAPNWDDLVSRINKGTIKFEHALSLEDGEVTRLISRRRIVFSRKDFVLLDAESLRKKRNGNPRRVTPPEAKVVRVSGGSK